MILHIVHDTVFIDAAYRVFESVYPGQNRFVLTVRKINLKNIKNTPVDYIHRLDFLKKQFVDTLKDYEMVVLHSMDEFKMQFVSKADSSVKFVWIGYGSDYYNYIVGQPDNLLLPETLKLKRQIENTFNLRQLAGKSIFVLKQLIKKAIFKRINKLDVLNRMDFFSPVLKEDFGLIKKSIPSFKPKYLAWNYGSLEDDLIKGFEGVGVKGQNILLGNSACFNNNHLDAIVLLSKIDLGDRKVICPLSYGDLNYGKSIAAVGNATWGKRFMPMMDFMPIDKYVELISSCSIVIMNHLRQQAVGNIVIMMYLGAKVFLDEKNAVYHFLKNEGAHVFSTKQLAYDHGLIDSFLSQNEVETNKSILRKHWSREAILEKTKCLVDTVKSYKRV